MDKIKARLIIELMGRPAEHIKEAINTLVVKMGSEKGVEVVEKKHHDPKEVENSKDLFMTFAEVEAEFDTVERFFSVIMGYMPSNVELYEPEKFKLNAHDLNSLANFIMSKLHRYDDIAKRAVVERNIVVNQLEYLKNGGKIEEVMKRLDAMRKSSEKKAEKKKS